MAKAVRKDTGGAPKKVPALTPDERTKLRGLLVRDCTPAAETGPPLNDPCKLPACPEEGTVTLKCVDGVIQWVV